MFLTTDKQPFCPTRSSTTAHCSTTSAYPLRHTNTSFHIRTVPSIYGFGHSGVFPDLIFTSVIFTHWCPGSWRKSAKMSLNLRLTRQLSSGMGGFILLRLPTQEKAFFCFSRNPHKLIFNKPKITSCCLTFLYAMDRVQGTGLLCIIVILHIFNL